MVVATIFFYLLAGLCCVSAFMVITARNPVHSVLFLILAFVNAAGLFLLMGAEFLAMILVIVYVGAVAVLFLFVVMMLDVDFVALRQGFSQYLPISSLVALIILVELFLVVGAWVIAPELIAAPHVPINQNVTNTEALGQVIYTKYVYFFQASGLILIVAMIGAIVLTLRHKTGVKRQDPARQSARTKAEAMEIRKVQPGKGL